MRRRVFLNKPGEHSVAAIYAAVEKGTYTLKMSDCDRSITFSIDAYDNEGRENSLFKVNTMIEVLTDFRTALLKDFEKNKKS